MSSGNGFVLVATKAGRTYELRAAWPAPFFVDSDLWDQLDSPRLIHCDDLQHARQCLSIGGEAFNASFEPVSL